MKTIEECYCNAPSPLRVFVLVKSYLLERVLFMVVFFLDYVCGTQILVLEASINTHKTWSDGSPLISCAQEFKVNALSIL